ncbi:MAG: phosphoenolpyruvate synthase, partial [Anaerolineae bacterium]|nr:phosphoenolpyruvate synthase [Anaerolineae bacterium]
WTARALAYRLKQGIDPATVSLAVVVQEMVPAEASGILFTANPVDGERDHAVINATWGLGEAIVGGLVNPDTVIVDKSTWRVHSRETGTKTVMTVRTETGTTDQPVPEAQQTQPVLDDKTAVSLAKLGTQIEANYGMPMDIEWALADGAISILQARPITKLPPAPLKNVTWEPPRPNTIWMRRQVVEHMPEPLSPLFDELYVQEGLDESMNSLASYIGELSGIEINMWDFVDPPFAATINGYAYSTVSFKFNPEIIPSIVQVYVRVLPQMIRHLIPRWENESLPRYLAVIAQWKQVDLAAASDEDLLRGIRELAHEDAVYWFAAAVPLGLARTSDAALDRFLKAAVTGKRLTSGSFLRGYPSKTAVAQAKLEAIARKIDQTDALREQVLNTPASGLLELLAAHPAVMAEFQQYLEAYGHQIYNLDFAAPTLSDDPLPVLLSLKTAVSHPERDALQQQAKLAQERDALIARTSQSLNPLLRPIFKLLLGWAQKFSPNREAALFYVGAAWPALRRLALELGQRLTDAGSLAQPVDVFYLKSGELVSAIAARGMGNGRSDFAQL